jgi:RimJ/RimL family protein N-acetyltransferase
MTSGIRSVTPAHRRIDWLGDAEIIDLLAQPELCRSLFGHPALLLELQHLMHANPPQALWYRPACVYLGERKVAAGGFKGPPVSNTAELGYRTHPQFRRQGHATALVLWLCTMAEAQRLARVVAVTAAGNVASQQVLAQTGFVHTGDLLSDSQQWLQRWQHTL